MTKVCFKCKEELSLDKFNVVNKHGKKVPFSYCRPCNNKLTVSKQRETKLQAIEYKGGKCQRCGYDKCSNALDFHHIDPSQKDFEISRVHNRNFNRIKDELDKCILICANCHREEHALLSG